MTSSSIIGVDCLLDKFSDERGKRVGEVNQIKPWKPMESAEAIHIGSRAKLDKDCFKGKACIS